MKQTLFGTLPNGEPIYEYELTSDNITASVLSLGGIIRKLTVDGVDVVAGFDTLADILADTSYQGALIGRYANRIRDGRFTLNGERIQLAKNERGVTHLHGGNVGFNRRVFTAVPNGDNELMLSLFSEDGEENYPGNLNVTVTYTVKDDVFLIDYKAVSDKDTVLNMTNHAYFNLNGYENSDILSHTLTVDADAVTEVDADLLPTGKVLDVTGTVFDVRAETMLRNAVTADFGGFDHNFILNHTRTASILGYDLPYAATLSGDRLTMQVYTDQPDMQIYMGNMLFGTPNMKNGAKKQPHRTICLETQVAPDSPNFGGGILRAGEEYKTKTAFVFCRK